jgi:hypothetical protein
VKTLKYGPKGLRWAMWPVGLLIVTTCIYIVNYIHMQHKVYSCKLSPAPLLICYKNWWLERRTEPLPRAAQTLWQHSYFYHVYTPLKITIVVIYEVNCIRHHVRIKWRPQVNLYGSRKVCGGHQIKSDGRQLRRNATPEKFNVDKKGRICTAVKLKLKSLKLI